MSIYNSSSLAMIPTAYKDGKLYSIRPTDGSGDFTFSRGSNLAATRVASSGYIEKGRENLLLQSNAFDTTWATSSASVTGGQTGYDGTSDAWLLSKSGASAFIRQFVSVSGLYTFSVYAKAGSLNFCRVYMASSVVSVAAYVDLTDGSVGTLLNSPIDVATQSVGGGWYRISITHNDSSMSNFRIYPAQADNNTSGTSGNIYIQDSQLEKGLVATSVIETGATTAKAGILEDMPRLDYSGSATCPSLLLEPQRSNLVDDYSGYTWNAFNGAAISFSGTQQSPEGLNNAVTWTFGGSSGEVVQRSSISISNSTTYTISGYFKLTSGTLTSGSNQLKGLDGLSGGNVSLNTLTSEWQRLSFSVTSSSTSGRVQLRCDNSATIQVYGLQLEAGSYETSIIPTFGSAVTRNGDNYLLDNMATNGITNDSAISFFIDTEAAVDTANTFIDLFALKLSNGENLRIESRTNDRFYVQCSSGFVNSGDSPNSYNTASFAPSAGRAKILFTMTSAQLKLYYNGSLLETFDGSYNINFNQFRSDVSNATAQLKNNINQALILTSAISNQEAIDLTTI